MFKSIINFSIFRGPLGGGRRARVILLKRPKNLCLLCKHPPYFAMLYLYVLSYSNLGLQSYRSRNFLESLQYSNGEKLSGLKIQDLDLIDFLECCENKMRAKGTKKRRQVRSQNLS